MPTNCQISPRFPHSFSYTKHPRLKQLQAYIIWLVLWSAASAQCLSNIQLLYSFNFADASDQTLL